ncbi:MAG TPA: hypothetical protein VEA44_18240 [Caulobacter sp.]|nr:hypothetical protein [Caulobacter sp.]
MRIAILAATAALGALPAVGAAAAEPQVTVTYGAKLQDKIDEYGARDVDRLAEDLRSSVLKQAANSPALDDAVIELVLEDVVPNRPTMQQMSDKPGLSYDSFGIGGASITGTLTTADGRSVPVSYRWYETDIRWAWPSSTWGDAQQTFDRFARRLARNAEGRGS